MRIPRLKLLAGTLATTSVVAIAFFGIQTPAYAGTRFGPSTTDTGQVWDLVTEFMFNNGDALQSPNDGNQVQNDRFEGAPTNKFWFTKQKDTTFWERFSIGNSAVALERDTTAPPGSPNNAYDAAPWGSLSMPRVWTVGQETSFSTTIKWFDKATCRYTGSTTPWPNGRHFLRWQGPINMGGSLGTIDVVIIDRYHWISDDPNNGAYWNPKEAERFWFARGRGWVRWDYFADRSTANWNRSDAASLLAPATTTIKFTNNYPSGNSLQPNKICGSLAP